MQQFFLKWKQVTKKENIENAGLLCVEKLRNVLFSGFIGTSPLIPFSGSAQRARKINDCPKKKIMF